MLAIALCISACSLTVVAAVPVRFCYGLPSLFCYSFHFHSSSSWTGGWWAVMRCTEGFYFAVCVRCIFMYWVLWYLCKKQIKIQHVNDRTNSYRLRGLWFHRKTSFTVAGKPLPPTINAWYSNDHGMHGIHTCFSSLQSCLWISTGSHFMNSYFASITNAKHYNKCLLMDLF